MAIWHGKRTTTRLATLGAAVSLALVATMTSGPASPARADDTSDPAYTLDDVNNMAEAYGRITGEGGQLQNPAYLAGLVPAGAQVQLDQFLAIAATPTRLPLTPAVLVPGWNVGNPLRAGWDGTRGLSRTIAFTNKYGALLHGRVYRPLPHATDPYTGEKLTGPLPGVVITPGSVGGSEGMYTWLAQDLAERGYLVLFFDVQGQGMSETLPHQTPYEGNDSVKDVPFCNPFAVPMPDETTGCPGVPFQQVSGFLQGTRDALDFFTSTPRKPYRNPRAGSAAVDKFNPWWKLFDRSPYRNPLTPGRTSRIAIIGHSMGARAVSQVQGTDKRVATVVALDKLGADFTGPSSAASSTPTGKPVVPGLGVQSEYGFSVTPWFASGGSSLTPGPSPDGLDPEREKATGFDVWEKAGVDSMVIVPRASTHLEYTDIPLVLPASRYGQAFTSALVQRWLAHYLARSAGVKQILARKMTYLEPTGDGVWAPVVLRQADRLSERFCSAYDLTGARGPLVNQDIAKVGC